MELSSPATALGVGGGDRASQALSLDALTDRDSVGGGRRESPKQFLIVGRELLRVRAAVKRRQHSDAGSVMQHRDQQRVARVGHPKFLRSDSQSRADVSDPFGAAVFEHLSGRRAGYREAVPQRAGGVSGAGGDDKLVVLTQHDHDAPCVDQRASALDNQLEHPL